MTFEELREKDPYGAFSGYMSVAVAKEVKVIEPQYWDIFKDHCECGSERIIRINLREVRCCDPRCHIKLGYYLSEMFSTAGVKGIGDAICLRVMKMMKEYKGVGSHILFLLSPEEDYPFSLTDHEFNLVRQSVQALKEKTYTYSSMIKTLSIPEFSESSSTAFAGIENSAQLIETLEAEGGLKAYLSNRGFHDPMKHFNLSEFIGDVLEVEHKFFKPMMPVTNNVLKVVCTGSLTFRGYKVVTDDFIETCNKLGLTPDGSYRFFSVEDSSAISSVHYVISEPTNPHAKANKAREREFMEQRKILYTCDEFFELLVKLREDVLGIKMGEE